MKLLRRVPLLYTVAATTLLMGYTVIGLQFEVSKLTREAAAYEREVGLVLNRLSSCGYELDEAAWRLEQVSQTQDYTADVTALQFVEAISCAYECEEQIQCQSAFSDDILVEILIGVCGIGWLQASDQWSYIDQNYELCQRELEWRR